jgi:hypothetical protein
MADRHEQESTAPATLRFNHAAPRHASSAFPILLIFKKDPWNSVPVSPLKIVALHRDIIHGGRPECYELKYARSALF